MSAASFTGSLSRSPMNGCGRSCGAERTVIGFEQVPAFEPNSGCKAMNNAIEARRNRGINRIVAVCPGRLARRLGLFQHLPATTDSTASMNENTVVPDSCRWRCPIWGWAHRGLVAVPLIAFCLGWPTCAEAQAPAFSWATKIGGGLDQGGSSIAVEAAGNSYVADAPVLGPCRRTK